MTDVDALTALLEAATAFSEEASPGPWWRETGVATSEEEHIVWLTNEGRDTLMVNADDAAMLVNALPSLLEAARREAGLREALMALIEAISDHDLPYIGGRLHDAEANARSLLRDNAGATERGDPDA